MQWTMSRSNTVNAFSLGRASLHAFVSAGLLLCAGCAPTLPKMNVHAPIEKQSGFLGTTYTQNGKSIDRSDMMSKLEQEPEAAKELSGHGALRLTSILFGVAGGGCVGYPMGKALAGSKDPPWIAAGVGVGLIAVAIPFAIVAENKVENAVDAHNRRPASWAPAPPSN